MAKRKQGQTTLITGFPGFIGKRLVLELAQKYPEMRFALLLRERQIENAEKALERLESRIPGASGRCEIVVGDIGKRNLGIEEDTYNALLRKTTHVWHLAALYNLAAEERTAYRVNVVGTVHVLDFCKECATTPEFNYISTCYVSGKRRGLVREVELDEGQEFKNHYESTKFWAEVEVQRSMEEVPTRIFRPGIVVGDSQTGQTDKYDGPYYIIKLLLRLPDGAPTMNIGDGSALVNIVPVDYAVQSMVEIASQEKTLNETFQIADPNPMRAQDIVTRLLKIMGKSPALGKLSPAIINAALKVKFLRKTIDVPHEAVVYFNHGARYDTTNTQEALANTSLRCPHLSTYLDTLVNFVEKHPKRPPIS